MIRIVTDTGANLPEAIIAEYNIKIVSGHILFGSELIREYPDLSTQDFYQRLAASKTLPGTRDSTARDFAQVYQEITRSDPSAPILSIHVSEALATTIG